MAMELSPNLGAGSAQFGTNCGRVFWAFYARNCVFVQVEPAVCYTCMLDFFLCYYSCFKKKNWKKIPFCVCFYSFLNSMLFLERNIDIDMHAIRLNLLENTMDAGFLCTTVYCFENLKEFPVCMCRVLV